MSSTVSLIDRIESVPHRELYFFALYRVLVAGLIAALVFSPLAELVGQARHGRLAEGVATGYLLLAIVLLLWGREERRLAAIVCGSTVADIVAATLITHALPNASAGIAMMLLFNVAAAAMLLRLRYGMAIAAFASLATVLEYLWTQLDGVSSARTLAELAMFATSYLALAYICHQIGLR
ncbi:PAS domain-containing sensor histidine kinase, partial [Xanthomonas sp. Kuri4-2]